jgi:phosphomannomutase
MSAHHYFRDFAYCDSGMIPWLLVAELLCLKNSSLKSLVADRQAAFRRRGDQPQAGECGGGDSAHPGAV